MGTSPAVSDFQLLYRRFRELSDQVSNFEIDHYVELNDTQKQALEASSRALERASLLFLSDDIESTLASIKDQIQNLQNTTAEAASALQNLAAVDKSIKIAAAAGILALSLLSHDPAAIQDALTGLGQAIIASA